MAGRSDPAGRRRAAHEAALKSAQSARAEVSRARRSAGRATRAKARNSSPMASFGFIGVGIAGLWMGLAHAIGWVVRAIGRKAASARDLDRAHQRDGGGLLLVSVG